MKNTTYLFFKNQKTNQYSIQIQDLKKHISVTEEVYHELSRSTWREDKANERLSERQLSLNFEYENNSSLENVITQQAFTNPEENYIFNETLNEALLLIQKHCTQEELEMISYLILENMAVSDFAEMKNLPRTTVSSRKQKLLKKLKNLGNSIVI